MINFKAIGQRIKKLRKEHSYTQEKLAEILDISTEHLSRIENGMYRPSLTLIEKICDIFDVSEAELMFGASYESSVNEDLYNKIENLTPDKKKVILTIIDLVK